MKREIDRPTFIVSPHRSGSTLLYGILGAHPDLGYYNRANRRMPQFPAVARLATRLGFRDDPMEAQRIWDRFWDGTDDVMDASHATPEACEWYRESVARVLELRGARRFLAKYPRLSLRLAWLDAIFPDAIFLHLVRDWRAVVNSTTARIVKREQRGGGWFGVRIPGWQDPELENQPPEVVAGRVYRYVTKALETEGPKFGDRYFRVSYEDICARPRQVVREIADRCDWPWSDEFESTVPAELRSANAKWRERLDPELIEQIRSEDPEFYARYESADATPVAGSGSA